jgi:hypothetical protein
MRRNRVKRLAVVLPVVLALGGCGSDPAPGTDGGGTASGEVLEGSISDAMLPVDTVQSQSPPLEKTPSDAGGSAGDAADNSAEASELTPETEEPAPEE